MHLDENKIYSTLGERSKDDQERYLIESAKDVYDFDEVTKEIADAYRGGKPAASCDALYIKDEFHIYLIEFKNARKSRIGKKFFLQKAYDSALTLVFAFENAFDFEFVRDLSLQELRERLYLIVVYNSEDDGVAEKEQESRNFQKIKETVGGMAGNKKRILFGLEIYKGVLYKDIITIDKNEFMKQIYSEIFTKV